MDFNFDGKSELWVKFFEEEKEKLQKQLSISMPIVTIKSDVPTKPKVSFQTAEVEVNSSSSIVVEPARAIIPIIVSTKTKKVEDVPLPMAEHGKVAKSWAEGIVNRHNNGKHTQTQELLLKLLKMRGQVQLEHERLLQSQRAAVLRALQSEFESHISIEQQNFDSKFHGNLLTTYLDCIEIEICSPGSSNSRTNSFELMSIAKPQTQQIVQMVQFYKEEKLKRAKESVSLNIHSKPSEASQHIRSSNDNAVKWALKEKLEEHCRNEYAIIDELYSEEEEDEELSDMKKLYRHNLAFAGQIALLQNLLARKNKE